MSPECDNEDNRINEENLCLISVVEKLTLKNYLITSIYSAETFEQIINMSIQNVVYGNK
jgi:hypothetical protein